jgi:phospholipid transport system substrate-binding protein
MDNINYYRIVVRALVLSVFTACVWGIDDSSDGENIVTNFHDILIIAMKSEKSLGYPNRINIIKDVVSRSFNFPLISKVVLGDKWEELSSEHKHEFVSIMESLSIATYAHYFVSYSGQKFVIVDRKLRNNSLTLGTYLISNNGERTSLKYLLQKNKNGWQIVNVISEGVSDLSLKKAEYAYIIKNNGIKSLLQQLKLQIRALKDLG